jgi:hypothetical protein
LINHELGTDMARPTQQRAVGGNPAPSGFGAHLFLTALSLRTTSYRRVWQLAKASRVPPDAGKTIFWTSPKIFTLERNWGDPGPAPIEIAGKCLDPERIRLRKFRAWVLAKTGTVKLSIRPRCAFRVGLM